MSIYTVVIIILTAVIIGLAFYIISISSALKNIDSQMKFISNNDTNKALTVGTVPKRVKSIVDSINSMIRKNRKKSVDIMRKDNEIKQNISSMAHDVRTPLTSLKGYFDLMCESTEEKDIERYKNIISERIDSLSYLLEQMFTYTKLSNNDMKLDMEKTDISAVFMNTLFSYYDEFEKIQMDVQLDIDENVYVVADEQYLKRVFENLIKNSLVHGEKTFRASIKREDKNVEIKIGNGISPNNLPDPDKVFDTFYKADKSRQINSSGIGLSVVKKLIDMMNAEIIANVIDYEFVIVIIWKAMV